MTQAQLFPTGDPRRPAAAMPRRSRQDPIPDWLLRRLQDQGHVDPETGATRRARASLCKTCSAPVMIGIDSDVGGMAQVCNPTPLTAVEELGELLAGRQTWDLRRIADAYQIDQRDPWRIRAHPAGTVEFVDTLAAHGCGTVMPHRRSAIPEPAAANQFDHPPF